MKALEEDGEATPDQDCPLCPRLALFRHEARLAEPTWFNAPVPNFGPRNARVLVVGLAPGLRGANRTGRPFTGDFAGDLLYPTLRDFGFAAGTFARRMDDSLSLIDCVVTNAVRCVPPQNKPLPAEIATCRTFLQSLVGTLVNLRVVVALGRIAHDSVLRTFGLRLAAFPFSHGGLHRLHHADASPLTLFDTYHCSRYNTNTGVLTEAMFRNVFQSVRAHIEDSV